MSNYHVILDENVPRGMEAVYANEAVRQAEARAQAETARREAERLRKQQIQATLAAFEAERVKREEKEAKEKQEREAKRFEDDLRASFLCGQSRR